MFFISAFQLARGSLWNLCSILCFSLTSAPPLGKARQMEQRQTKDKRLLSFPFLTMLPAFYFCSLTPFHIAVFSLVSLNILTYWCTSWSQKIRRSQAQDFLIWLFAITVYYTFPSEKPASHSPTWPWYILLVYSLLLYFKHIYVFKKKHTFPNF